MTRHVIRPSRWRRHEATDRQNRAQTRVAAAKTMKHQAQRRRGEGRLDCHFLDYFDDAFFQDDGSDMGCTLLMAIRHFEHRFGRRGEQTLPRSHRALQGLKKRSPSFARPPLPIVGLMGTGLHASLRPFALAIMIGIFRLRPTQRVTHARTNRFGATRNMCRPPTPVLGHTLVSDWLLDQITHTKTFHSAAASANAAIPGLEPCSLRNGGAPHDALTGHREPGPTRSPRTMARRLLSPMLQKGNLSPPTLRLARSCDGGLRTDHGTHSARRQSLQTAFKQCLAECQRAPCVPRSVRLRPRTDMWARQRLAALHIPLTGITLMCYLARSVDGRQNVARKLL